MRLEGRSLRTNLRILLSALPLFGQTGCAMLAGLDFGGEKTDTAPTGGSTGPVDRPRDKSLPPAPATDCGDVSSSPTNCGWCGHSCQGLACNAGRCEEQVVVAASSIDGFVTDGVDLFVIADGDARACKAAGPADQLCTTIVSAQAVRNVVGDDDDDWDWDRGSTGKRIIVGGVETMPLQPKALALSESRILIADDAYHVVLSCPTKAPCDEASLGAIDTRDGKGSVDPFGRSIASGPSTLAWTQGNALLQAPLPTNGAVLDKSILRQSSADTANTARVAAPAEIFWLSSTGLHFTRAVGASPERWSDAIASDFSVDKDGVYLATQNGVVRVGRTDRVESQSADGEFQRVAASGGRVYATTPTKGGIEIVELRAGKHLDLALVPGAIASLAIAGDFLYYAVPIEGRVEVRRIAR